MMNVFSGMIKWVHRFLIITLFVIIGVFTANAVFIHQFNAKIYSVDGYDENGTVNFFVGNRDDSTSSWKKRDFDLYGETVDLKAQTLDGTITNNAGYEICDWSFVLQIKDDCFINNAWCGTVEIHQNAGTADEKVQTLDLRKYSLDSITLDYLYDGDLLIPLHAGDYLIYYPSEADNELPVTDRPVDMGFILYYLDTPDLTEYTMSYQYHRDFTDSTLFYVGLIVSALWLLAADGFIAYRIAYHTANMKMEMKKSGISSMSDIYSIIYIVDLKKNELIPVVADKESEKLRPKEMNAQSQLRNLFELDSTDMYREAVLNFCDLNTVGERIENKHTLVCEYISRSHGWCQLRFFAMERSENKKAEKLIFTIQVINDEKTELEELNAAVKEKTESIIGIQQKVVVGLANMIENRDNNTGGHVKRTSDVIRIIVDEIIKQGKIPMSPSLAEDIVRAAPMHDLGKITIDSSILCKPGKLTEEEFAIMKTHSAKSGEMVKLLLDGVEEKHFVETAFHIARYHHERWDGHGYPDGLQGESIPLEARIMAIADVYDALVSKRCYKEPMSFEQAYQIMTEGMGSQFDPQMKEVFENCHDKLEAYYGNNRD